MSESDAWPSGEGGREGEGDGGRDWNRGRKLSCLSVEGLFREETGGREEKREMKEWIIDVVERKKIE